MEKEIVRKFGRLLDNFGKLKKYKGLRIRNERDLAKVPLITKDELAKYSIDDCPEKPVVLLRSSGTTGQKRVYTFYSKKGYEASLKRFVEALTYMGVGKKDTFFNGFTLGELFGGSFFDQAAIMAGVTEIPIGEPSKLNDPELVFDVIKNIKPTVIFSFPNQLYGIFHVLKRKHSIKK